MYTYSMSLVSVLSIPKIVQLRDMLYAILQIIMHSKILQRMTQKS